MWQGMAAWRRAALVFVACVGLSTAAYCQAPTGAIVGTVIDPQGLPVEGATITLTNQETNYQYTTTTSSTGAYQFTRLDYGVYRVTVTAEGFRVGVVQNIKLDAATDYAVPPLKLEVGTLTESVTVEAGAELVNTTDAQVTSTVEKKQIDDLPILDRNPLNLLGIEAGVGSDPNSATNGNLEVIGGQRTSFTNMTLDGINIQDNFLRGNAVGFTPNYVFNSQAQEFTVINQNAGVEQGGGTSQISMVTPKGSNAYHGEAFWYYRSNSFAANDWFNDASGIRIPNLLQNQGGGNIGGPIKKDKLFFYGWYELLRLKTQTPNNTTVLSPTILAGLESSMPTVPFTYQPVNVNTGAPEGAAQTVNLLTVLNQTRGNPAFDSMGNYVKGAPIFTVDSTMAALLKRMPTTFNNTRVGDGTNLLGYQFNERDNDTLDNYGVRVDYDINARNTITGTWAWNRQIVDRPDSDTSFNLVPAVNNNDKIKFLSTAWRWNPTNSATNELRFGFNLAPAFFYTTQNFGVGYVLNNANTSLPFTDPNPNFVPEGRNTRTWMGMDNASWVKGNHVLKFGAQVERVTIFSTGSSSSSASTIYPTYTLGFSSANPFGPVPGDFPAGAGATIGTADLNNATGILASVAGILSQVGQYDNVTSQKSGYVPGAAQNQNYRQNQFAVYAGDVWRINPKLTLSYGLRWEFFTPVDEKNGLVLLPVVPQGSTIQQTMLGNATIDFAGGNSYRGLYNDYWKAFAPNIGIAWDPFGNGKTSIRAGFSMNYVNDFFFSAANNAAAGNTGLNVNATTPFLGPPASNQVVGYAGPTVSNPQGNNVVPVPPFGIPRNFMTNAINAATTTGFIGNLAGYGIDPNIKPPYVEQWNLSIQRDIGWNTSLSVSYVGNHGVGLFRAVDLNQLNLSAVDINGHNFFTDFQTARAYGFQSLAAGQGFNPVYGCPGQVTSPTCLPVFNLIFGGGIDPSTFIGVVPSFVNLIQQGQIGALIGDYHADTFDTATVPGQDLINFFPNPYIMGADLLKNTSFSTYHAGIVEVRRRFSRGLYFQANYTFSKVLTDYGGSQAQFQPFQDNARPYLEKQRAPFDINHAFKANFTYEIPIGKGHGLLGSRNKLVGLLVDGWKTGSIFTWQSGEPFSIVSQYATFNRTGFRSNNNTAVATLSHQQISGDLGVFVQPNGVVYLINPKLISPDGTGAPSSPQLSCVPAVTGGFCNPQPGEVGNLQLDAFSGPAYFDWDVSAGKDFNLTERFKLTFRTEAFNVLNHPVFAVPIDPSFSNYDMNINSTTFGQSTALASSPRILQFSLLLKF
ncbi:MAG TPA: TonB-dependent receptor [Candidatus Sulfotelmatobacter sp.]|nr:TonB-dependent receptor [Candidatus Sulfotelmatobacter sp.]